MDVSGEGGPVPLQGEESGGSDGDGSLRDVIDKIHLVISDMGAKAVAAKMTAAYADTNTEACASLAGRLVGVLLKPLNEFNSTLANELSQVPTADRSTHRKDGDAKGFRWLYNVNDRPPGVSESSDETDKAAQHTKAVSTGDGKRSRVGTSPAAAAAAAASRGGGSSSVGGAAGGTQQQRGSSQGYGRPCLPGLPEGVMGHLGSFVSTKTAARMPKVNRETRQKAIDETFGVFRHFSVTEEEGRIYENIQRLEHLQHLDKIQTAYVGSLRSLRCVSECLEASRATLKDLHVPSDTLDRCPDFGNTCAPGDPMTFPRLLHMDIGDLSFLIHVSERRWAFPNLRSLRIDTIAIGEIVESLFGVLERSPKIERLQTNWIHLDDDDWRDFIAVLAHCPHITIITGVMIRTHQFGRLNDLKQALNPLWSKPENKDVPKKLGFVVRDATIGVDFGQGAVDGEAMSKWAAEVNCELEWRPEDVTSEFEESLLIDCSSEAANAPHAPGGFYADSARQLARKAPSVRNGRQEREAFSGYLLVVCGNVREYLQVEVKLGGTALHSSWRDTLVFPRASTLSIDFEEGASGSAVVESIPEWLIDREGEGQTAASRSFPHVELLKVHFSTLSLSDLPSAPSKLSRFIGGLTGVKRVRFYFLPSLAVGCELLSYLSGRQLAKVDFVRPLEMDLWPRIVRPVWALRAPPIEHLTSPRLGSTTAVMAFLQLVSTLRPAKVDLSATLPAGELGGGLRLFAWSCFERVQTSYNMARAECGGEDGAGECDLELQLVAE